jgi:ABC-type phosphate transport system substrate-binding protein
MMVPYIRLVIATCIQFLAVSAQCGESGFRISSSAAGKPLAHAWANEYGSQCGFDVIIDSGDGIIHSSNHSIIIENEDSNSSGIDRLCSNISGTSSVDIVINSRDLTLSEASPDNDTWHFKCLSGDTNRKFIRVDIAIDTIAVVVNKSGYAVACVDILGGLTQDQLRWMFSNYTVEQLQTTGWSINSLSQGVGDPNDRYWNRLHQSCNASPISVAGPGDSSEYFHFFVDTILKNASIGEKLTQSSNRSYYNFNSSDEIVDYITNHESSIGFLGFSVFTTHYDKLTALSIQNIDGLFIHPNSTTIQSNLYNPLSRRFHFNFREDKLHIISRFLLFGFSNLGDEIVEKIGYSQTTTDYQLQAVEKAIGIKCVSMTTIECCPRTTLKVVASKEVKPYFEIWQFCFEARCSGTTISVTLPTANTPPCYYACKVPPETGSIDIAAIGSYIHNVNNPGLYPVSVKPFIFKCPKNQVMPFISYDIERELLQFVLAPGPLFMYTGRAEKVRIRTECFLKFALCKLGSVTLDINNMPFNAYTTTTLEMCNRTQLY